MGAPKKNTYWQNRVTHGRPMEYSTTEALWEAFEKYYEWNSKRVLYRQEAVKSGDLAGKIIKIPLPVPLTIQGFCVHAGIAFQTFQNYCSGIAPWEGLFEVATYIRESIQTHQLEGASLNILNPNIVARLVGLADKKDVEQRTTTTVVHLGSGIKPPSEDTTE